MGRIRKLLIANRGEIASRVIRSARALDIATVAVFSEVDALAPFVTEADESVSLSGCAAAETYLRADLIIDAARRTGADAVHPGYGFLSENAEFARGLRRGRADLYWAAAGAIRAMGSKTSAKQRMAEAGVPGTARHRHRRPRTGTAELAERADDRSRVPSAGQGGVRRRRARHAGRHAPPMTRSRGRRGARARRRRRSATARCSWSGW